MITNQEHSNLLKEHRKLMNYLSVPVQISHNEVDRIVVNRLIEIRNSDVNTKHDMSYLDKTLRFFLDKEEFKTHVIGNQLLKP